MNEYTFCTFCKLHYISIHINISIYSFQNSLNRKDNRKDNLLFKLSINYLLNEYKLYKIKNIFYIL
jgi:hypothetical protein